MKSLSMLDLKASAIVIVDLQKGYCDPNSDCANILGWDVGGADQIAHRHIDFLKDVRTVYPPKRIIWLRMEEARHSYAANTSYGPHSGDFVELCVRGTPGHDYHGATPNANEPEFLKFHPSGFSNPDFVRYLKENEISQLIFTGVIASRCVNATVIAASAHGHECVILKDLTAGPAHISSEIEEHLKVMGMFYAPLVTSDEFIKQMNGLRSG